MPRRIRLRPEAADEHGLVAVGGNLSPETLLDAYRSGVFPWYEASLPVCWWSPDPRAIIPLDGLHVGRRLARTLHGGGFHVTVNRRFADVIRRCADRPGQGTWITSDMMTAYIRLHELGHAHSVDVWRHDVLAGGLYGVAIGGLFAGESMFHDIRDASKVALAALVERLTARGYRLFDIQFLTPHTARMGGVEITRSDYLQRLRAAVAIDAHFA